MSDQKNKTIIIDNSNYIITKELHFQWPDGDYRAKYKYFEAKTSAWPFSCIVANYKNHWGAGENFYTAAVALESSMFAAYRELFMGVINGERKIVTKEK